MKTDIHIPEDQQTGQITKLTPKGVSFFPPVEELSLEKLKELVRDIERLK